MLYGYLSSPFSAPLLLKAVAIKHEQTAGAAERFSTSAENGSSLISSYQFHCSDEDVINAGLCAATSANVVLRLNKCNILFHSRACVLKANTFQCINNIWSRKIISVGDMTKISHHDSCSFYRTQCVS